MPKNGQSIEVPPWTLFVTVKLVVLVWTTGMPPAAAAASRTFWVGIQIQVRKLLSRFFQMELGFKKHSHNPAL